MSIYDEQFNEDPQKPRQTPVSDAETSIQPPTNSVVEAQVADGDDPPSDTPRRRRGCGCGSCLLAMFLLGLSSIAICGVGGYLGFKSLPSWTHGAIVAAVNDSDLDQESKRSITADMDRLLKEYNAGKVSSEQLGQALDELGESPVLVLVMVYATMKSYVEPSGLSDEEKSDAKLAFQRVARGTFEKSIDPDDLEEAFNFISKKDFNGNRQIKSRVTDEELRSLVKECRRVADEAEVPDEPYQVDVAGEVKRIVDRAVGIEPDGELDLQPMPSPNTRLDEAASAPAAQPTTLVAAITNGKRSATSK